MKSIRTKLVTGLTLIILFFLTQAALVWWSQNDAKTEVVEVTRKNTIASSELGKLAVLAQQIRRYEKEYFVYVGNETKRNEYAKEWTGASEKITALLNDMSANKDSAFTRKDLPQIVEWSSASAFYSEEMKKIFTAVRATDSAAIAAAASAAPAPESADAKVAKATKTLAASLPTATTEFSSVQVNDMIKDGKNRFSGVLIKGVSEMSAEKTKATLALGDVANASFEKLLFGILITVAVGVLLSAFLMLTLPKSVTAPLDILTKSVDEMSKGNLDTKIDASDIKEFAGLSKALERMRLGQQAMLTRIRRSVL